MERDRDLAVIHGLLTEVVDGRGSVVLVEGPPGIGKTALLAAVREHAAGQGVRSLGAIGGELEQDLPFDIVRQLFEPPLRAASPTGRTDLLAGAAGLAAPVFGVDDARGGAPMLGDVVHGLYWVCANLAEAAPCLLIVDDVHWADDASLRFLSHLSRRIADLPVLLLVAGRPGRMLDDLIGRALSGIHPSIVRLRPLSDDAVGMLVRQELSADADDEFCHACAVATGGNPFLLTEALTSLHADGVRPAAAEARRVEHLRPDTISRAVLTRVARLGPEAVRFVRALAVLGPAAAPRQVAQLAELPVDTAASVADALARDAIVTADRPVRFVHPLVRNAVYADSSALLRAAEHKRAARVLAEDGVAAEQLAPHLLAAEPESDPWVVDVLRKAAAGALGRGAPEPAATYLRRARGEPPSAADRAPLAAELGRALGMAARPSEAAVVLREAIELIESPLERLQLAFELGFLMVQAGRGREAAEAARLAHSMVDGQDPDLPPSLHAAFALSDVAIIESPLAWVPRLDRVASTLEGDGDADRVILSLLAFGAAVTGDRPAANVARLAERSAAGPLPVRDGWVLVNTASAALTIADRMPEALDLLDRGLDATRKLGNASEFRYLAMLRSHTAWFAGRLVEAEGDARSALEEIPGEPRSRNTPLAAAMLIDALVERGQLVEAQQVLDDYDLSGDQPVDTLIKHFVPMARGRLRLRQQQPAAALADFLGCGQILVDGGYTNPGFAEWRADAVLAHLAVGDADSAAELAARNLDLARAFEAPRAIALALRVSGLVARGDRGLTLLAEAAELLAGSPARLEYARCLVDYGAALRRAGQRKQALDPLRLGLDVATGCGAAPLASRAIDELHAAGARPRRAAMTGRAALTASELRIARIAAEGVTNREIAQTLFLSTRTVEVHLTNAYRKLGIDTRQKLRSAIEDLPS
jgi:DNA-binding CsgD family transcriptional regulator